MGVLWSLAGSRSAYKVATLGLWSKCEVVIRKVGQGKGLFATDLSERNEARVCKADRMQERTVRRIYGRLKVTITRRRGMASACHAHHRNYVISDDRRPTTLLSD